MKFLGRSHQSFLLAAASIAQGCKAKKSCLAFSQPLMMRTRSSFSSPSAKAAKKGTAEAKPSKLTKKLGAKRVDKKETVVAGSINESPWYRIFTKGDQEYDNYMATEWSFEKVGNLALDRTNSNHAATIRRRL